MEDSGLRIRVETPRRGISTPDPRAQAILDSLEDSRDRQLLHEMNGAKCVGRQMAIFFRGRMRAQGEMDKLQFRARRRSETRKSKVLDIGHANG